MEQKELEALPIRVFKDLIKIFEGVSDCLENSGELKKDLDALKQDVKDGNVEGAQEALKKAYLDLDPIESILSKKILPPLVDLIHNHKVGLQQSLSAQKNQAQNACQVLEDYEKEIEELHTKISKEIVK